MKRHFVIPFSLIFLFQTCCFTSAFSQTKVGVRIGTLFANATVEPNEDNIEFKAIRGFQVAMPFEIGLGGVFALQPELMYGFHGARIDESTSSTLTGITTTTNISGQTRAYCLEIPVLAKAKFGSENTKVFFLAGPSLAAGVKGQSRLSTSVKVTTADGTVLLSQDTEDSATLKFVNDGYSSSDLKSDEQAFAKGNLNFHVGAGLSFRLGSVDLVFDARYIAGLSDLSPNASDTTDDDNSVVKGQRLGFALGVMVPMN